MVIRKVVALQPVALQPAYVLSACGAEKSRIAEIAHFRSVPDGRRLRKFSNLVVFVFVRKVASVVVNDTPDSIRPGSA